MTLRTAFGARPLRIIDRASASTSAVVTSATRRGPIAGEMWTRCIDSQFCRYDLLAPWSSSRHRPGQALARTRLALRTEPPVALPTVRRPPAPVVGAGLLVDVSCPVRPSHAV